jgi:hypothetical protein
MTAGDFAAVGNVADRTLCPILSVGTKRKFCVVVRMKIIDGYGGRAGCH